MNEWMYEIKQCSQVNLRKTDLWWEKRYSRRMRCSSCKIQSKRNSRCKSELLLKRREVEEWLRKSEGEGVIQKKYSYVSKSDRLGSSDVWLKSPATWNKRFITSKTEAKERHSSETHTQIWPICTQTHSVRHASDSKNKDNGLMVENS